MTSKNYRQIARVLRRHQEDEVDSGVFSRLVLAFEAMLRADNPRFDPKRFEDAIYEGEAETC